jgi:hypothetical protein
MKNLIISPNGVYATQTNPEVIQGRIRNIEACRPMLIGSNVYYEDYCKQVYDLLEQEYIPGYTVVETYKQRLKSCRDYVTMSMETSRILWDLQWSMRNAIPIDQLPQVHPILSVTRDELIKGFCKSTHNNTIELIGNVVSLVFKVKDLSDIGYVFSYYCTLVDALSMNQQYENERRLLAWAKAQRGYAFFAFIPTVVGGAVTIAHLVDEATALKDIEEWEKRQGE